MKYTLHKMNGATNKYEPAKPLVVFNGKEKAKGWFAERRLIWQAGFYFRTDEGEFCFMGTDGKVPRWA